MSVKDRMEQAELEAERILNPETDEEQKLVDEAGDAAENNPRLNPEGQLKGKIKEIQDTAETLFGNEKK
ncbi:MAG: hypothetical protein PHS19_03805 [Eubacteriales bacterium]|nr:hypothetical protein [Eubacteriales bacterium]